MSRGLQVAGPMVTKGCIRQAAHHATACAGSADCAFKPAHRSDKGAHPSAHLYTSLPPPLPPGFVLHVFCTFPALVATVPTCPVPAIFFLTATKQKPRKTNPLPKNLAPEAVPLNLGCAKPLAVRKKVYSVYFINPAAVAAGSKSGRCFFILVFCYESVLFAVEAKRWKRFLMMKVSKTPLMITLSFSDNLSISANF